MHTHFRSHHPDVLRRWEARAHEIAQWHTRIDGLLLQEGFQGAVIQQRMTSVLLKGLISPTRDVSQRWVHTGNLDDGEDSGYYIPNNQELWSALRDQYTRTFRTLQGLPKPALLNEETNTAVYYTAFEYDGYIYATYEGIPTDEVDLHIWSAITPEHYAHEHRRHTIGLPPISKIEK